MDRSKEIAVKLKSIMEQLAEITPLVVEQLKNSDNRNVRQTIQENAGQGLVGMMYLMDGEAAKAKESLELLDGYIYLQEMELLHGKGTWREVTDENRRFRVSVVAIKALRTHLPDLSLKQAKLLTTAFAEGLFE